MSNILRGIQQALEAIRIETEAADWQLRLDILQLIPSTSESVVAGACKQAEPEVKQVKQTVAVPKTKWVKRYVYVAKPAASGKQKQADMDDGARLRQQRQQLAAVQPNKPLHLQQ
ncbi:MAG: hypothetical protein P8O70_01860 [SAR324 cluster bacterium]|nr:hypothetical protein [SAR324 cluster bacterium]